MKSSQILAVMAAGLAVTAVAAVDNAALGPGLPNARYATDAYPGFDTEEDNVKPERKEPKWFSFINGPNRGTAAEQFAYCQELVADESYSKARKQLDALVREWPTSPEAWKAQQQLAEICLEKLADYEEAFKEFRYLLDFYSLQCDYGAIADKLYQIAGVLKLEGKEIMFVRFANTVDVRRAYEACVLRAPGAKWVPEAMLTIAALRIEEGKPEEAVKVCENLRNLHPGSEESKTAVLREAEVRMDILRERGYNRSRCRDTIDFMKLAMRTCRPVDVETVKGFLYEAQSLIEDESYRSAKFYDSPTRTKRSAINAYEKFLEEFPESARAEEVRARVAELKEDEK